MGSLLTYLKGLHEKKVSPQPDPASSEAEEGEAEHVTQGEVSYTWTGNKKFETRTEERKVLVEEIELDRSGGVPVGEEDFNVEEADFKEEGGAVEEDEDSNAPFTKWKETDSMTCSSEWTEWNNRQRVRPMMRRRD